MPTSKRDPRRDPQPGDRVVKLVTDRRGVTRVTSRTVLTFYGGFTRAKMFVHYTPKNAECHCTLAQWRKWAKGARPIPRSLHP